MHRGFIATGDPKLRRADYVPDWRPDSRRNREGRRRQVVTRGAERRVLLLLRHSSVKMPEKPRLGLVVFVRAAWISPFARKDDDQ
jgi:hypothetical protein